MEKKGKQRALRARSGNENLLVSTAASPALLLWSCFQPGDFPQEALQAQPECSWANRIYTG